MLRAFTWAAILIAIACVLECEGRYYPSRRCRPGVQRKNKCRELCECSSDGSRWVNCVRQRKEFTTMTRRERKRYVKAIKTVSSKANQYNNVYNELITNHTIMFMTGIHNGKNFLTWHRWYLLQYENLLRQIDCRVTLPYWDWSATSGDPWSTQPGDLWYSGSSGFGGNGNASNMYCVADGPFSGDNWKPPPSVRPDCNRRRFHGNPPDYVAILELLEIAPENFTDFEMMLRVNFHNTLHCQIGGTMCSLSSSGAPEFFLHHAFVDKIWADWQSKSKKHKYAYFPALTGPLPGTGGVLPKAVVDNDNLLGYVRVDYLDINDTETKSLKQRLKKLSPKKLRELKRIDFDDFDEESMTLFNVNYGEKVKAKRRGRKLRPKNRKSRRKMKSRKGRRLGFDAEDLEIMEKELHNEFKELIDGFHNEGGHRGGHGKTRPKPGGAGAEGEHYEGGNPEENWIGGNYEGDDGDNWNLEPPQVE